MLVDVVEGLKKIYEEVRSKADVRNYLTCEIFIDRVRRRFACRTNIDLNVVPSDRTTICFVEYFYEKDRSNQSMKYPQQSGLTLEMS